MPQLHTTWLLVLLLLLLRLQLQQELSASAASALAAAQMQQEQQLLAVREEQQGMVAQAKQDLEALTQQLKEQVRWSAAVTMRYMP